MDIEFQLLLRLLARIEGAKKVTLDEGDDTVGSVRINDSAKSNGRALIKVKEGVTPNQAAGDHKPISIEVRSRSIAIELEMNRWSPGHPVLRGGEWQ
jgi:hypothetical protein